MQKNNTSWFTLIEILVVIVIIAILALWVSNINFNAISDKQRLDKDIIKIISQIETIRNNSILWKWIWVNLDVPEKYEIHIWNTWSWNIKLYYNTWWVNTEYDFVKKINFWNNYEYISKMNCLSLEINPSTKKYTIIDDEDGDNNIQDWTWKLIFEWANISLSWACDKAEAKILQVEVTRKQFKRTFQINTLNWLIEIVK